VNRIVRFIFWKYCCDNTDKDKEATSFADSNDLTKFFKRWWANYYNKDRQNIGERSVDIQSHEIEYCTLYWRLRY
jgi:hypothetical protein